MRSKIMSRVCPHIGNDSRVGDEHEWCVVCLRAEVERLTERIRDVAERQREACAERVARVTYPERVSVKEWCARAARTTPLVTEVE